MMDENNKADCWPSVIEGVDLSNSGVAKDPLLIGHSFEPPSIGVTESTNNNNGNFDMVEGICKPFVGMEFDTIEDSHVFWERYARETGFRARVRSSKRRSDGVVQSRTYVCAKEGTSPVDCRHINPNRRCGCGVIMIVCLVKGKGIYRAKTFVEEHNHGLEGHLNNSENVRSVCKPIVGMEFDTVEACGVFWEQYARDVGFRARIRSSKKDKGGVVRSRQYVCSKEGKKCENRGSIDSERRPETRCGCGVFMSIAMVKGKGTYRVVTFIEEHNHGFDVKLSVPRRKAPSRCGSVTQRRETVVVESPPPISTNTRDFGINDGLNGEQNLSLEGPLFNLTNAQRMGILCAEFMQLAHRAVGSNEAFEGVRRLIKDGHSLANNYYNSKA